MAIFICLKIHQNNKKINPMKTDSTNSFKSLSALTLIVLIILFSGIFRVHAQEKVTNAEKLGFPKGKKIILLHSDDAGMCEEANIAVWSYSLKNHVQSAAVMMPCPNAEEMVEWAKKHPECRCWCSSYINERMEKLPLGNTHRTCQSTRID
jgi:hypothetical protein